MAGDGLADEEEAGTEAQDRGGRHWERRGSAPERDDSGCPPTPAAARRPRGHGGPDPEGAGGIADLTTKSWPPPLPALRSVLLVRLLLAPPLPTASQPQPGQRRAPEEQGGRFRNRRHVTKACHQPIAVASKRTAASAKIAQATRIRPKASIVGIEEHGPRDLERIEYDIDVQ